jgi:NADH dehydrogenase
MATRPQVVIVGAGFGGLAAAKRLEGEAVDVVLIDRHNYHTFQPLLYQVATAGLNPADVGYATRGLFRRQRHVFVRQATVAGVDWVGRRVILAHDETIPFDHLILAAGASTNYFGVPGAREHAFPLYTLDDSIRLRNHVLNLFEAADVDPALIEDGILNFVIVGGGPTGVEVAGALAELVEQVLVDDFHDLDVRRARILLVEQLPQVLAPFSGRSQRYARSALERRGVEVRVDTSVQAITTRSVTLRSTGDDRARPRPGDGHGPQDEVLPTRTVVWAAGVRANDLATAATDEPGRGGRVPVNDDLSVPGHPGAYAVGDVAAIADGHGGWHPQLAQVAMQSGRHAAEQILATIAGRPTTGFHYVDKGTMATIGRRAAVAELRGGLRLTGVLAWLAWLLLHLVYLVGARNKVSVLVNWAWNYLTWDRGPRLILRPEEHEQSPRPIPDALVTTRP